MCNAIILAWESAHKQCVIRNGFFIHYTNIFSGMILSP